MSVPAPAPPAQHRATTTALLCTLGLVVVARAWFLVRPDAAWWGINLGQYHEPAAGWFLVALAAAGIGWSLITRDQPAATRHAPWRWWHTALIVGTAGLLFWFAALPYSFLGDSTMYIGELWRVYNLGEHVSLHKEPIPMLLAEGVFKIQTALRISGQAAYAYRITGAACGMAFVWLSLRLARELFAGRSERVAAVALLLSCGGSLLFFGYVESYAVSYVFVLAYCLACFRFVAGHTPLRTVIIALALCVLGHFQYLLLLPSLGALLLVTRRGRAGAIMIYRTLAASVVVMIAVYAALSFVPRSASQALDFPLIPLRASEGISYTLFSAQHLVDIVNEHLLLAAVPLAIIACLGVALRKRIAWTSPEIVTGVTMLTFMEAFLVGGNFNLGLARDWDVSSAVGVVLCVLALIMIRQAAQQGASLRRLAGGISAVAVAGAIAWVSVNGSIDSAIRRYESLVTLYRPLVHPRVTRFGYENLRKYYGGSNDVHKELQYDKAMLEILPYHYDALRATTVVDEQGAALGAQGTHEILSILELINALSDSTLRSETAGDEGEIRLGPHGSGENTTLGDIYFLGIEELQMARLISQDQALACAESFITRHPALPYGYELKGRLYFFAERYDSALPFLNHSIAVDPSRARPYYLRANVAFSTNAFDSARADALRSLARDSLYYVALNGMSILLEQHAQGAADSALAAETLRRLQKYVQSAKQRGFSAQRINDARVAIARTERALNALRRAGYQPDNAAGDARPQANNDIQSR